jgi:hypothetical protein
LSPFPSSPSYRGAFGFLDFPLSLLCVGSLGYEAFA